MNKFSSKCIRTLLIYALSVFEFNSSWWYSALMKTFCPVMLGPRVDVDGVSAWLIQAR